MPLTKATANVVDFASPSSQIIAVPGDDLLAKYAQAITLTPQGNALSATNRATLIIYPGVYTLSAQWNVTAEFVDILGIGDQLQNPAVLYTGFNVDVSANNVRITGIGTTTNSLYISGSLPLNVFKNCKARRGSFAGAFGGPASGTYVGCLVTGGVVSGAFGIGNVADGTFINCKANTSAFAGGDNNNTSQVASGVFDNCESQGGFGAFGGFTGTARNCKGGSNSFASTPTSLSTILSGTCINCEGGISSFGNGGLYAQPRISGSLYYCRITPGGGAFATVTGTGITRLCIDGNNTENNQG
jgi:hypothetical protein